MAKQPGITVDLRITRDSGVDTPRYSTRPFGGPVFTAPRVRPGGWEPIRRELSDDAGQPRKSTGGVELLDDPGDVREAMAEDPARFLAQTEARVSVLSEAGRVAGLDPRTLLRARVDETANGILRTGLHRRRTVRLGLVGALAPYYDQPLLKRRFLRADYPDIHRDLENTFIPWVIGEHSDAGAEDVNGNSAEKGLVPALHAGSRKNVFDDPTLGTPSYLAAPAVTYAINGTPGTTLRYYVFTSRSASGESLPGTITVVDDAPAVLDGTNNIEFTITPVAGATGQVVYGRRNPTPVRRLRELAGDAVTYIDDGSDVEYAPGPPAINTAQVADEEDDYFWDFYIYSMGYAPLVRLFGSDVAVGTAPRRIDITATRGVDFIEFHGVIGGNEVSGFYARGPRSQHHIDGVVTFAVQTCGVSEVGNAAGDPILQAFPQLQLVLNELVFKDGGAGYASGTFGPLEEWADGTPMVQPSKFTACQDLTKVWLDNAVGYLGAMYLRDPMTVREFIVWFNQTFDCHVAENHHGQVYPVLYDTDADLEAGQLYRERIEIVRLEEPLLDKDHVEPQIFYQFDYDPDAGRYRSEVLEATDDVALDKQRGKLRDPGIKLLRFTRDATTAQTVMERRRDRLKYPRWRQGVVLRFAPGLTFEPGDPFRVIHADGATGTGWTLRPFFGVSQVIDPNTGEVVITGYDRVVLEEAS